MDFSVTINEIAQLMREKTNLQMKAYRFTSFPVLLDSSGVYTYQPAAGRKYFFGDCFISNNSDGYEIAIGRREFISGTAVDVDLGAITVNQKYLASDYLDATSQVIPLANSLFVPPEPNYCDRYYMLMQDITKQLKVGEIFKNYLFDTLVITACSLKATVIGQIIGYELDV